MSPILGVAARKIPMSAATCPFALQAKLEHSLVIRAVRFDQAAVVHHFRRLALFLRKPEGQFKTPERRKEQSVADAAH